MFSSRDIIDKIDAGESSGVEFKRVEIQGAKIKAPARAALSDEIAAFANQYGGVIIFGVEDDGDISGIEDIALKAFTRYISEICRDSITPPIVDFYVDSLKIQNARGEKKNVVFAKIGRSSWLHESSGGHFYRHGDTKRKMSTAHILRVGQSRSRAGIIEFDEQAVPRTDQETLQRDLYTRFIRDESNDVLDMLRKRRLLTKEEGDYRATVAGVLMCNSRPDQYSYLYNSFIQAVYYRGGVKDANYQIDAKDFRGPLDRQIIDAFKFVEKYNKISATKTIGRMERPQYSMKAIFEAVVNAVVHRDYSISGSKIRLFMFADRLEISSPGALANTLTVGDLRYNQVTRNEILSRLLSEITLEDDVNTLVNRRYFLERRGEGVGIILRESEELSGREPVYEVFGAELRLTIFAAKSLQDDD